MSHVWLDQLDAAALEELTRQHGTPLMVFSRDRVRDSYRRLQECLPRVELMYAIKANPYQGLIDLVAELGGGFDVASLEELDQVTATGTTPDRVVFTHPIKTDRDLREMWQRGITTFFFDNEYELRHIAAVTPGAGVVARVAVFNPNCVVDLGYKFGLNGADLIPMLELAVQLGLKPTGIAFHVGSQSSNPYIYVDTLVTLKGVLDQLVLKGIKLELIDIGGGFPVQYLEPIIPLEQFCAPIAAVLENYYHHVRLLAEPGRGLAGPSSILITRVIGKAKRRNIDWYYLDDGLYGSFSGIVFDGARYRIDALREGELRSAVLAGPTCDSFDVILKDASVPDLEVGDLLVVDNIGAYSNASATNFNGRPKTPIIEL